MNAQQIIAYYDLYAHKYDEAVFQEEDYIAFRKIPLWILAALQEPPQASILDLGCGTGLSAELFFERGYALSGMDISPAMIKKAGEHPFQALYCQSLEEPFPLPNSYFDAAQLIGVMEFIQNPQKLFFEVSRVLKKGAIFALTVPQKLSPEETKALEIHSYTKQEIEPLFVKAGFSLLHRESFQGFISEGITVHYTGYLLRNL